MKTSKDFKANSFGIIEKGWKIDKVSDGRIFIYFIDRGRNRSFVLDSDDQQDTEERLREVMGFEDVPEDAQNTVIEIIK